MSNHKYWGFYRLRNGIVVEAYNPLNSYSAPVTVVFVPRDINQNDSNEVEFCLSTNPHNCLIHNGSENPLDWTGGAWGDEFTVVERMPDDFKVSITDI